MFEVIKYRWKLQKLEKECSGIRQAYAKHRKGLSGKDLEELYAEESSVIWPVSIEIDELKTGRICQIANRLIVPLPDSQDKELWEDNPYARTKILSTKGFWELKKLIRQEKRERREVFVMWFAALTGITGIIGAITGLIAVLTR